MNAPARLAALGQSIWIDDIRRDMLGDGTLQAHVDERAVTGLTSNPSIFDKAIAGTDLYDEAVAALVADGTTDPEEVFFALGIEDLQRAADVFRPVWDRTGGLDGCVSLEVSPRLADDTDATVAQAAELHGRAGRPNLMIKIPGTPAGLPAITRTIAAGIPVNVTLLFSVAQYEAQAEAWMQGLEQRHAAGEPLGATPSVASIFVSRWDVAANAELPEELHNLLGIGVCAQAYASYRRLLAGERWQVLAAAGAHPQRLLFASTSMKDPSARDTAYVEALAAPDTVDTMPTDTLLALADHGEIGEPLPDDGGPATADVARVAAAGVDVDALAQRLQQKGKQKFVDAWDSMLSSLAAQIG
jgi:transaldolase